MERGGGVGTVPAGRSVDGRLPATPGAETSRAGRTDDAGAGVVVLVKPVTTRERAGLVSQWCTVQKAGEESW